MPTSTLSSKSKSKSKSKKSKKKPKKPKLTAQTADKYELYQNSVQEPEADVRFFRRVFKKRFNRRPTTVREDFCGTGYLSCCWVADHIENEAIGVDLDPEPLAWGRAHNVTTLAERHRARVSLLEGNALDVGDRKVDIVAALNFSFFTFRTRDQMREYFRAAYRNLGREGLFILDLEGGPEAQQRIEEPRECDGFTYVWDQDRFDAITNETRCFIHFEFSDGSRLKKAFSYEWRLWSMPEVRELLAEAGFPRSEVYWEGTDKESEEGNGVFSYREHAQNEDAWIAYVVGVKE